MKDAQAAMRRGAANTGPDLPQHMSIVQDKVPSVGLQLIF